MALNFDSPKPLYEQIRDYILDNIQSGHFAPDTRIPSERTLSEQFGVSRLTVKRAIDDLTQAGYLYVQIGKGTYISRPKVDQQLETLTSFTEEMSRRGQTVTSRVLESSLTYASENDARYLRLTTGTPLVLLRRLRLSGGIPMAIERTKLVASQCPKILENHDFSRASLYDVLGRVYHIALLYAEQSMEARLSTDEESHLLQIEPRSAILQITRVTFTHNNQPVEYVRSAYCGGRYTFQTVLHQLQK